MKKFSFVVLLVLVGVGAYYGWKMLKGEGGCCGWGGEANDPWSTYQAPEEEAPPAS